MDPSTHDQPTEDIEEEFTDFLSTLTFEKPNNQPTVVWEDRLSTDPEDMALLQETLVDAGLPTAAVIAILARNDLAPTIIGAVLDEDLLDELYLGLITDGSFLDRQRLFQLAEDQQLPLSAGCLQELREKVIDHLDETDHEADLTLIDQYIHHIDE